MKSLQFASRSLATLSLAAVMMSASVALAEQKKEYTPQVGQQGKDVVWVPTPQQLVEKMLDVAKVTAKDYVIDLGSGDGRTVITAAKRGATAVGIEYNPNMVELAKKAAQKEGVTDRATFMKADIFESDFSKATVITLFLLPQLNVKLRPKILEMKPGTRVVSNSFDMGDWMPDETIEAVDGCTSYCRAFYWVVPAKVAGTWKLPQGELKLEQKYQMLTGTLSQGGNVVQIGNAKVLGDQITFTANNVQYTGRVSGNSIEGLSQTTAPFSATRG